MLLQEILSFAKMWDVDSIWQFFYRIGCGWVVVCCCVLQGGDYWTVNPLFTFSRTEAVDCKRQLPPPILIALFAVPAHLKVEPPASLEATVGEDSLLRCQVAGGGKRAILLEIENV